MTISPEELSKLETIAKAAPDCGDNSCRFAAKRGGMRTNGGCRCLERSMVHWNAVEKYAAGMTPAMALRLIEEIRAKDGEIKVLNGMFDKLHGEWFDLCKVADFKDAEISQLHEKLGKAKAGLEDCHRYFDYSSKNNLLPEGAVQAMTLVCETLAALDSDAKEQVI